ncbi:MAG: hypothetical protein NDI61_00100 [Bdellovibrionaceae bacterium]|nr:hypothetical protein [Pseudobdellovibrionaceae bacterium]
MSTCTFAPLTWIASLAMLFVSVFLVPEPSLAYIPSTRTILNRMARTSGRGIFQIEQDVQFRTEGDPIVLRERWLVENGDSMHLTVSSVKGSMENWSHEVRYKDGKRWIAEPTGQWKAAAVSLEFIEPYLHFRSGKGVLESLIRQRVLPTNLTSMQKRAKSVNGVNFQYETFVRLARTGGVITYAFGPPAAPNGPKVPPGFWVDQDAFQFRRLRLPSAAEVEASNHFYASSGLRIPRDRTISWDANSVSIRVISVKSVSSNPQVKAQLANVGKASPSKLPDHPQVREFYQRFR